jgi:hypothetical protein
MKSMSVSKSWTVIVLTAISYLLLLGNTACSRETAIYSDPAPASPITPAATNTSNLPKDFYDQSVGQAKAQVQPDGVSATSKAIELKTTAGVNAVGAFNGGIGTGSKAILGFNIWREPILNVFPLGHDVQKFAGSEVVGVSLQVDLSCDGNSLHHLIAHGSALTAYSSGAGSNGYSRVEIRHSDPVWVIDSGDGLPLRNPDDLTILVPADGNPPSTLNALLARYPNACVSNGKTAAKSVAKGIPTAGVQWSLGLDDTTDTNSSFLKRLRVGSDIFEELE